MESSKDDDKIDISIYSDEFKKYIDTIESFESGVIIAKYFTDHFILVDFKANTRCKIPLNEFKFVDTKSELESMYCDKSDADSERVENFPDYLFVPIKKFKDLDKVIYGNNGNVYVIRGYLSVAKNAQPQPEKDQKGEKALIYKFDFKKMESKIVYVFEEDICQFTCQRFRISKNQQIAVTIPYAKKMLKIVDLEGILIAGGKTQSKFIQDSFFLCTKTKSDEQLEIMYIIYQRSLMIASPLSCIINHSNTDYLVIQGGYTLKDFNKKLERTYYSMNDFTTLYFDIDRDGIYKQKHGEDTDDGSNFWNLKNYIIVPTNTDIYVLGGVSKIEDSDMELDHFSAFKYECKFIGLEVSSISISESYKAPKIRKTAIFEEDSSIDHCYLANVSEVDEIRSICTLSDSNRLKAMTYNIADRKVTFKDLISEYRPIPFSYTLKKSNLPLADFPDSIILPLGISEEFFDLNQ